MNKYKLISYLPIPSSLKLEWHRNMLNKGYSKDIASARNNKDFDKVASLEHEHRSELKLHQEDEDFYCTSNILRKARKLRLPIPHIKDSESGLESECWYQSSITGRWYLTNLGYSNLRKEIRNEIDARHKSRTKWLIWLTALSGLVGTITGLIAIVSKVN